MSKKTKEITSLILSILIFITCMFYTYSSFNLPFRKVQMHIQSENNINLTLREMIQTYNKTKDSVFDYNESLRQQNVTISSSFKVSKIEKDNGCYKIYSKEPYNQFGIAPFLQNPGIRDGSENNRYLIIYSNLNDDIVQKIFNGVKIKYTANFNKISDTYLIMTNGDIEIC